MCGSSDFLDIKEYSRELREAIYPKLRKNLKNSSPFAHITIIILIYFLYYFKTIFLDSSRIPR